MGFLCLILQTRGLKSLKLPERSFACCQSTAHPIESKCWQKIGLYPLLESEVSRSDVGTCCLLSNLCKPLLGYDLANLDFPMKRFYVLIWGNLFTYLLQNIFGFRIGIALEADEGKTAKRSHFCLIFPYLPFYRHCCLFFPFCEKWPGIMDVWHW